MNFNIRKCLAGMKLNGTTHEARKQTELKWPKHSEHVQNGTCIGSLYISQLVKVTGTVVMCSRLALVVSSFVSFID